MSNAYMDAARARESKRLSPKILEPVNVYSLSDIKRIIEEYNPYKQKNSSPQEVTATFKDDEGNTVRLSTSTRSKTKREYLLEGLSIVRKHLDSKVAENATVEVNGQVMKAISIGTRGKGSYWVDPIIRQWLGGYREEAFICWDVSGCKYKYDIFEHRLFMDE
jgi:hypothetical protein